MSAADFGSVECIHWRSADEVQDFIDHQGIASMLAFRGGSCVGQLYVKLYDPSFREPGGWTGNRPWADFSIAEPLGLSGRFLTLGCFHVGRRTDGTVDPTLQGRGFGRALLSAMIDWLGAADRVDGLLAWAMASGSRPLLDWAGQLSHDTYRRFGFRELKAVRDARLTHELSAIDVGDAYADPCLLHVMVLDPSG